MFTKNAYEDRGDLAKTMVEIQRETSKRFLRQAARDTSILSKQCIQFITFKEAKLENLYPMNKSHS